ncbi:uncharacterized protein LOC131958412 [Physella acuta]|uniref:uncharacterized protein LOC131958412 n=1 Tax=Physella acuta TaxID=109671 RepID=UPI0027DB2C73|nr:uncharacterized protein LOC131958412 [Physella acuta]XP_059179415.1 uncharacterized protein LOC131958412 [Physella acuta]XP_059179416.1 uncharacterized protein LOC131958412 [Physella acuta]XP_059179417.1 uncharacterized protein LOC131958412 [Physella acuta]
MYLRLVSSVAVCVAVLLCVAGAELDDDDVWWNLMWLDYLNQQNQNTQGQCGAYGGFCNETTACCQYPGYDKFACFNDVCLQEMCGYPGQYCGWYYGYYYGACCYHLGLTCSGQTGTCVQASTGWK